MTSSQKDAKKTCPLETKARRRNKDHERELPHQGQEEVLVSLTVKGRANGLMVDFL